MDRRPAGRCRALISATSLSDYSARMRGWVACAALAIVYYAPQQPAPSPDYAALVREYRAGSPDTAVNAVSAFSGQQLQGGLRAFLTVNQSPDMLAAAAAMHAEAALRPRGSATGIDTSRHFAIATGLVEQGMPSTMRRLGAAGLKSRVAVAPRFRRLFFLAAIASLQDAGSQSADDYLQNARLLFPHDPDVLRLSGIAEEMRASGRLIPAADGVRRTALGHAEAYLREALELEPGEVETKLRLGRVLAQREQFDEARTLLTAAAGGPDARRSYLASLFLGGLEDAARHADAAAAWYAKAGSAMPSAQVARIAASELRHRAGARQDAMAELSDALGPDNSNDPWWTYLFGEFWRIGRYLDEMRAMSRA